MAFFYRRKLIYDTAIKYKESKTFRHEDVRRGEDPGRAQIHTVISNALGYPEILGGTDSRRSCSWDTRSMRGSNDVPMDPTSGECYRPLIRRQDRCGRLIFINLLDMRTSFRRPAGQDPCEWVCSSSYAAQSCPSSRQQRYRCSSDSNIKSNTANPRGSSSSSQASSAMLCSSCTEQGRTSYNIGLRNSHCCKNLSAAHGYRGEGAFRDPAISRLGVVLVGMFCGAVIALMIFS